MRRLPVAFALIDAAFLADTKFRALRRRLPEPRDYNSAIGAWLIILTAARRNGIPDVDAIEEAEDPTFIEDLIKVGLLTPTGIPEKPYRAWAPARPRYASDGAPTATNVPNVTSAPFPPPGSVSTPFPSIQLPSLKEEGGTRGDDPFDDPEHEALVWLTKHGCSLRPGNGYHQKLVLAVEQHGVNAVVGMMDRLASAGTKQGDIKGFLFGAIDALNARGRPSLSDIAKEDRADETERSWQVRVQRTKRLAHENGFHIERDPTCEACDERTEPARVD